MKNINKKSFISKIKTWHLLVGGAVLFIVNLILTLCEIYKWDVFSSNTLAIISLISILIVVVQMNMQNSLRNKELVAEQTQRKEDIERLDEQRREDLYYQTRPYIKIGIFDPILYILKISNVGIGIAEHVNAFVIKNEQIYRLQLDTAEYSNKSIRQYYCTPNMELMLAPNGSALVAPLSNQNSKALIADGSELFFRCLNDNDDPFDPLLKDLEDPWELYVMYSGITKYKIEIIRSVLYEGNIFCQDLSYNYTSEEKPDYKYINKLLSLYKEILN